MRKLFVLIALVVMSFSGKCGEFLEMSNDSLTPIAPKGYVFLTEGAAKRALRAKIDAEFWEVKASVLDSVISEKEMQLSVTTRINKSYRKKLFWRTLWFTGSVGLNVYLISILVKK
jgi:hypothetical protein